MKQYIDGYWVVPTEMDMPATTLDTVAFVAQAHESVGGVWLWWALGRFYGQEDTEDRARASAERTVRANKACIGIGAMSRCRL